MSDAPRQPSAAPRLSVIVPAYNEESCLGRALESLGRQTYPDFEVLVVDDGSSDGTARVAGGFPVRVLRCEHRGPAAARNRGAREARGEILVFVDADMTLEPDFLEHLTEPIRAGRARGTFTTEELVANLDNRWARCWSLARGLPAGRRIPADHPSRSTIFRAVGRRPFLEVGGFTEDVGYTDDDTLAAKLGATSVAVPAARCHHENPPDLGEVFRQARWIGRSRLFVGRPAAWLIYSPPVSLVRGLWQALRSGEPGLPLFRQVHDLGILCGILSRWTGRDGGHRAK